MYNCCKKAMTPYVENLKGDIWLEKCEICGTIKICTRARAVKLSQKNADRLKNKWAVDCGIKPHE